MGARGEADPAAGLNASGPVLLFDGECGLCASGVQFMLRHDRRGAVRFAPLQGTYAALVRGRHPALNGVDSMVWVAPGRDGGEQVFVRSEAGLAAASYLGGVWRLAAIGRLMPSSFRDRIYDLVARHRHGAFGSATCLVPTPEQRARFLA
jgi:predicted DCC family thiol-disulfide oxidoreductase YuxK